MSKSVKTNALRLLDKAKIKYEIKEYQYDEEHLSGEHIVSQVDMEAKDIFKTLVLKGNNDYLVCCIPVLEEIDLKKLAKLSKHKSVAMIPMKELLGITGYIRGGCSPVGMKKQFVTTYHETAQNNPVIMVSGGKIGTQVECKPDDLLKITKGQYADICKE